MSLSVLSASMPTRDHMITNRLPSAVKVPVLPQRHHMRDHDVFYGILLSPDVIGVNCLDVVALKVTLLYNRAPLGLHTIQVSCGTLLDF